MIRYTITFDEATTRWTIRCNPCGVSINTARKENTDRWRRDHICVPPSPLTHSQRIRQEHTR